MIKTENQKKIAGAGDAIIARRKTRTITARGSSRPAPRVALILVSVLLGITLGLILVTDVTAMPPHPELIERIRSGQTAEPYYLKHKAELMRLGVNAPVGSPGMRGGGGGTAKAAVSGNINMLAILVDFSDKIAQVSAEKFDTLIYVDRSGTVTNYYKEVSYNTLTITTVTLPSSLGWKRAPQTLAYYANNQNGLGSYPQNAQKLVEDAVDLVDAQVNFSLYDNDSDGYVDGLIVIHAGRGAELSGSNGDIWSHMWAISPRLRDGVYIYTYSMEPEYWVTPGDMTCGVYCHELGHVFGLPDLYDTDYTSEGVGKWSLMAAGSWNGTLGASPAHPDVWSKIELGFLTPTIPSTNQSGASILQVETNASAYRLWTSGTLGSEYFLLENRQRTGYDAALPADGLLIWHIDESRSDNDNEWWPGCGWTVHYKVALVQADNLWEMEKNIDQGDAGDPFPGSADKRTFGGSAAPGSSSYSGSATNVAVNNISNSGAAMTADIAVTSAQDIAEKGELPGKIELSANYPNPFNASTMLSIETAVDGEFRLAVIDIKGVLVKEIFSGTLAPGSHSFVWDGLNSDGTAVGSGIYFCRLQGADRTLCRKMTLLR